MELRPSVPAPVFPVHAADALELAVRARPALCLETYDRSVPDPQPHPAAAMAEAGASRFRLARAARNGLRIPAAGGGRVLDPLRTELPDHDGRAVQPFGPADGAVQARRTPADVIFRSHADRPAGQPDDHRYRCDHRDVQRGLAHLVDRRADDAGNRCDHVRLQRAPGAVGDVRRPSAADHSQFLSAAARA